MAFLAYSQSLSSDPILLTSCMALVLNCSHEWMLRVSFSSLLWFLAIDDSMNFLRSPARAYISSKMCLADLLEIHSSYDPSAFIFDPISTPPWANSLYMVKTSEMTVWSSFELFIIPILWASAALTDLELPQAMSSGPYLCPTPAKNFLAFCLKCGCSFMKAALAAMALWARSVWRWKYLLTASAE